MAYQHSLIITSLCLLLSIAVHSSGSAAAAEIECQLPAGVHPILLPFEDEETALMEARCHVVCAQKLLNESLITDIQSVWPSIPLSSIRDDCKDVKQVMECRRGCVTALKSPELFLQECRDECVEVCNNICQDRSDCNPDYDGTGCPRICTPATSCDSGCDFAHTLINLTNSTNSRSKMEDYSAVNVILDPTKSLILTRTAGMDLRRLDAGVFDVTYDIPLAENDTTLKAFLFRVELDNSVRYILQSSLSDPLDLSYFACKIANVSFTAVDTASTQDNLQFSSPIQVLVHGVTSSPSQITHLRFDQVREIYTDEFYGSRRGLINMSWDRPNGFEHLTHYTMEIITINTPISGQCYDPAEEQAFSPTLKFVRRIYTIDRNATSFLVKASTPIDLPAFSNADISCVYQILVLTHPQRDPFRSQFRRIQDMRFIIGADRIEQSVVCSRQVNKTTGQIIISVNWQGNFSHLPPSYYGDTLDSTRLSVFRGNLNSTLRDRGIERRLMIATFIDGLGKQQLTHRFRDGSTVLSQLEVRANGSGVIHLLGLSPFVLGVYDHFLLLFQQHVKGSFRYRLGQIINSTECVVLATPIRPDPIDNASIVVTMFEIYEKTRVNLSISWDYPNATYGDVSSYEVIVTKEPLSALDSVDTAVSVIFRISETPSLNDTDRRVQLDIDDRLDSPLRETDSPCLFIQAHVQNEHSQWSNWSDPVSVAKNTSYLVNCGLVAPQPATESPSLSLYDRLWIGVGAGLGAILITVVLLAICVPLSVKLYRQIKKKMFNSMPKEHHSSLDIVHRDQK